jgi:hypothetical protein
MNGIFTTALSLPPQQSLQIELREMPEKKELPPTLTRAG